MRREDKRSFSGQNINTDLDIYVRRIVYLAGVQRNETERSEVEGCSCVGRQLQPMPLCYILWMMQDSDALGYRFLHLSCSDPVHAAGQGKAPPAVWNGMNCRFSGDIVSRRYPNNRGDVLHRIEQHFLKVLRDVCIGDVHPCRSAVQLVHKLGHHAAGDRIMRYRSDRGAVVIDDADTEEAV